MNKAVIVQAKRTAIGKVGGMLKDIPPEHLVAPLLQHMVSACRLNPSDIDDIIVGNTIGPGGNIARLASLTAGLPVEVPGVTIDRQCGSGLEAIHLAARLIQAGAGHVYFAGGVESVSRAPWKMEKPSHLYDNQGPRVYSRAAFSPEEIGDPDMGIAAENVIAKYDISREEQDRFALRSHLNAVDSMQQGSFQEEIVPLTLQTKQGELTIATDECPRSDTSIERLSKLPPVFKVGGLVTAGNACPVNDGAALVLLMSEEKANALGLKPMLIFEDATVAGVDPNYLGIGPVPATQKLLARQRLTIEDIDLIECNEAFAGQVLACLQELHIPWEKVNVGGGAIALGHPYGASGAILVTRLAHELTRRGLTYGIATLGIGGGLGLASLYKTT